MESHDPERQAAEEATVGAPEAELLWPRFDEAAKALRLAATANGDVEVLGDAAAAIENVSRFFAALSSKDERPPNELQGSVRQLELLARRLHTAGIAAEHNMSSQIESDLVSLIQQTDTVVVDLLHRLRNRAQHAAFDPTDAGVRIALIDRFLESAGARQDRRRQLAELERASQRVEGIVEKTRQAAGVGAETSLAAQFKDYADDESRAANWLRGLAVATVLGIAAVAVVLLLTGGLADADTGEQVAKLSIGLSLGALAAYFGKEASRHRDREHWARQLQVRLLTFDAFAEPMSKETQEVIRMEFARWIFTDQGTRQIERPEIAPSLVDDASSALDRAARTVAGESPSSDKPQ